MASLTAPLTTTLPLEAATRMAVQDFSKPVPHRRGKRPKSVIERFWPRVRKTDTCWWWTGSVAGPNKYGVLSRGGRGGKPIYTHRLSWMLANECEIPDGLKVLHHCDNPRCVNPAHLRLGTQKDNVADMLGRGRMAPIEIMRHQGSENGRAKLTDAQVHEIREHYAAAPRKQRVRRGTVTSLAVQYGVTPTTINLIVQGKGWRHL